MHRLLRALRRGRSAPAQMLLAAGMVAALGLATASASPTCTDNFTGPNGGDWGTASNWTSATDSTVHKAPSSSDVACWSPGTRVVVASGTGATAAALVGADLSITGGSLTIDANATDDSSIGALSLTGGSLGGPSGRKLTVAGDFDWNVPGGRSSSINGQGALAIAQTGSHSFVIEGAGVEVMDAGSLSTPNDVAVSDPNFASANFPAPTLTTAGTISFAAGSYVGGNFAMKATGVVTAGGAVQAPYSLDLTGSSSSLGGDLTVSGLSSDAGTTLTIPSGDTLTAGGGTIAGSVAGAGSYVHAGTSQEITSGGTLSPSSVTAAQGALVVDSGAGYSAGSTTISGSGGLEVDDSGATTGPLTITGGSLQGSGKLTVAGDFDWNVAAGATSAINAGNTNSLTVAQTGSHAFQLRGSGTESMSGGLLTTSNPVTISNPHLSPGNIPGPSLTTASTVTFAAGAYDGANLTITAGGIRTAAAVSTQYSLDLTASSSSLGGDLTLAALGSDANTTLTIPQGDTVSAGGGTISGTVNGPGTFEQNGRATTVASGGGLATGAVTAAAGQLTISSGASYATGATTVSTSSGANPGRLEIDDNGASTGPLTITGGSFNGPRLNGSGKLTVAGDFDWNTPTGAVSGINDADPRTLTVAQTGTHSFNIEGPGTEFINGGTLTTPNPVTISNPNFTPTNIPGPSLTTTSTVSFTTAGTYPGGNLTLTAAGVNLAAGATTLHDTLDLTGGSTPIAGGSALTADHLNESGGTLTVDGTLAAPVSITGGTLKGVGTVGGNVDNQGGVVAPGDSPGALTVSGNYTQGPNGTLGEEIAGTGAGSEFDQLTVGGSLSLDGTLAIDSHSFTPKGTDTFKIISGATSRTATFAQLTGATVNGVTYSPQYDSDGVTLNVVAPPPPANISAPSITGSPDPGQTLTCHEGSWSGNPTSFTYQWNRDGAPIGGAIGRTYLVQLADQGHALTCLVTASNAGGAGVAATSPAVDVPPPAPPSKNAPVNTSAPAITGTPLIGQTVGCDRGAWTHSPTGFAFQWDQNGVPIPSATGETLAVPSLDGDDITGVADADDFLTCTVVASNADGASAPATSAPANMIPPSPALRPANTSPPTISGSPLPGQHLLCSPGHWTESPTHFSFQWTRDGHVIPTARQGSFIARVADRGHTLACVVTAVNVAGASQPATSGGVAVAQPETLGCPEPRGFMHAQSIGPLTLGMTRRVARSTLPLRFTAPNGIDDFCLFGGWDIRAGYPSPQLLGTVPGRIAKKLKAHVVILLTSNPFYSLRGVVPGVTLQAVRNFLHPRVPERIGSNGWYFISGPIAVQIFEVQNDVVQQVGLADDRLMTTRAARQRLIDSFHL